MPDGYGNILLEHMPAEALAAVKDELEHVELKKLNIIAKPAEPIEHVYFVVDGILSVLSHLDAHRDVELGLIGREGMSGEAIVLDDDRSPFTMHVEMPGTAFRIPAAKLRSAMDEVVDLRRFLTCFVRAQVLQVASTAAANQRGSVQERLARWLLMGFDRVDFDNYRITHDALAWLVGARRAGITDALHVLEGKGLIRSKRSDVTILDPAALSDAAGGTYGIAEREYARLVGVDFRRNRRGKLLKDAPQLFMDKAAPEDMCPEQWTDEHME
ncbi:MAG: Crp/Fnr family transcriptional regulator [Allorhizobium sp.]